MKIVAEKSLILAVPVLDEDDNTVLVEKKYNNVVRKVPATENMEIPAHKIVELDDTMAMELIEAGHAREVDAALDDEEADSV